MIILRSSLAKAVKFPNVSTIFSIVICDKIVLASVYLPNSQIRGDQFAASVHEFQTAVTQCFCKGAKSVIGGGDLNYKASGNIRNCSGNNVFSQATTSSANYDRDVCARPYVTYRMSTDINFPKPKLVSRDSQGVVRTRDARNWIMYLRATSLTVNQKF